jgi:hypothetical protein
LGGDFESTKELINNGKINKAERPFFFYWLGRTATRVRNE